MSTVSSSILRKLWSPHSYAEYKRYIDYFSTTDKIFNHISQLPPIVSTKKINKLRENLIECENNNKILFHAGDCAEPFEHVNH
jgi:3-deoxy-D-arabino-heptulosonate 7-phosphate (DAHP) synthase class II